MEEIAESRAMAITNVPSLPRDLERTGSKVKATGVVNSLNKINFLDGHVFVKLRYVWSNSFITIAAKPEPGDGSDIQLLWDESEGLLFKEITSYEYCGMFYTDGLKMVWVNTGMISMDSRGIILAGPEGGEEVSERNCRRHKSLDITTKITQGIITLQGMIKDYSAVGFAIAVSDDQISALRKINTDMPVNIFVGSGKDVLFDATCRIVRESTPDSEKDCRTVPCQ